MILTSLEVDPKEFERRTGWVLKPEGACKGERGRCQEDRAGKLLSDVETVTSMWLTA